MTVAQKPPNVDNELVTQAVKLPALPNSAFADFSIYFFAISKTARQLITANIQLWDLWVSFFVTIAQKPPNIDNELVTQAVKLPALPNSAFVEFSKTLWQ